MESAHKWYEVTLVDEIDSPALLVYPDRVSHNIQLAISMAGDASRLRPHVKTHKSPEVTRMMLKAGISKFKCATIAEAEMLAQCSAPDILLAYQPIGPKLWRFITLIQRYPATTFSCLVDDAETAAMLSAHFGRSGLRVPVYLDINTGMGRTGVLPEEALRLYSRALDLKGITIAGLHAYDGHIADADFTIRKQRCDAAFAAVENIFTHVQGTLICGGSPTFSIHCTRPNVECSPGTFVYWDQSYLQNCSEQSFLPAAVLLTRVISLPGGQACIDLGHKSVAAENPINQRVSFLDKQSVIPVKHSEEHMVIEMPPGRHLKIGDVIYGLPFHVCPTVALYERMVVVTDGRVTGEWLNVARDRKITI